MRYTFNIHRYSHTIMRFTEVNHSDEYYDSADEARKAGQQWIWENTVHRVDDIWLIVPIPEYAPKVGNYN